jgi:hypothetical protein
MVSSSAELVWRWGNGSADAVNDTSPGLSSVEAPMLPASRMAEQSDDRERHWTAAIRRSPHHDASSKMFMFAADQPAKQYSWSDQLRNQDSGARIRGVWMNVP